MPANTNRKVFNSSLNRIFKLFKPVALNNTDVGYIDVIRVSNNPTSITDNAFNYRVFYTVTSSGVVNATVTSYRKTATDKFYINKQTGEIYMHVGAIGGYVFVTGGAETIENAVGLVDLTTLTELTVV